MGGGLMQLVAYGAQDVYLTGNPQITFWKVTYRRYTNFAMESIEQTFNGQADFGRRVTCTISRNGDLAYRTYLQVTLPEINQSMRNSEDTDVYARWLDFPGHQLISQVEVEIGGQRIDRQYGDWMHIWTQLTLSAEQQRGYFKMIGNTTALTYITDPSFADINGPCGGDAPVNVCAPRNALPETTLYVPLQFWYCCNPGLALPLIALQYHEVKINLDLRPIDECLWAVAELNGNGNVQVTTAYNQSLVAASLYVDYVFLDTDERRRMAQNPHEYLIEQLQFTGDESVGSSSNKIKLNFNHPCKELVWFFQRQDNLENNDWFNFANATPGNEKLGSDIMTSAVLRLNGHYRFNPARGPLFFRQWQPFIHHTRIPDSNLYVYSFALRPEEHQPSGTCNFSRIDNTILEYGLDTRANYTSPVLPGTTTPRPVSGCLLNIYARNYNVLRIMSGMGGLAYSN